MFKMTLAQLLEIIDDQIEMENDGPDRNKLIEASNLIFDHMLELDKKKKDGKKKAKKKKSN